MSDEKFNILSHVSLGTNDFERAVAFYDKVLPILGCRRIMAHPGAVAYGKQFPRSFGCKRRSMANRRQSATGPL